MSKEQAEDNWLAWFYGPSEPAQPSRGHFPMGSALSGKAPERVEQLVELWLEEVKTDKATRTFETYRDQWDLYLFPANPKDPRCLGLRGVRIKDVNRAGLRAYFNQLKAANEQTTSIARIKTALSGAFKFAVENEWLDDSPVRSIPTPTPRARVKALEGRDVAPEPMWIPTLDQVNEFLEINKNDPYFAMWHTGFTMAPRPGELVLFGTDCLEIGPSGTFEKVRIPRQGYKLREEGRAWEVKQPKYNSGRTLFAMSSTIEVLMDQIDGSRVLEAQHPEWPEEWRGLLWRNRKGYPIEPSNLTQMFQIRAKRAGWPPCPAYTMRHFCLSALLDSDNPPIPLIRVANFAGHHDGGITLAKTYAHFIERKAERATEARALEGRIGLGILAGLGQKLGHDPESAEITAA